MERFSFEFSQPLSWPLAFVGVTPWTAHVDVGDDDLGVRFGPWSLVTPLSNVEGAQITGPYLPFKVLGPHVSLADRGVTFGTSWHRGVCVRFRRPVAAALPGGLLEHPAVTLTVARPERLVALLERRPVGVPGEGDELRLVSLPPIPSDVGLAVTADLDDDLDDGPVDLAADPVDADGDAAAPTPVAAPPVRGTPRATERPAGTTRTTTRTPRTTTGTGTRTPRRRAAAAVPEHPTPADMPLHTPTEKVPGVTPPADEDLPGPDSAS